MGMKRLLPLQVLAVLALAASEVAAQEAGAPPPARSPAAGTSPGAAPGAAEEPPPVVSGIRARLVLKRGSVLEGILPRGEVWETQDPLGGYEPASRDDPRAGIRVHYVLGIEGAMFFRSEEIQELKTLGPVEETREKSIQENVLDARRRALEEQERRIQAEMERILGKKKAGEVAAKPPKEAAPAADPKAPAGGAASAGTKGAASPGKPDPAAERRRKGDELLERFPFPDWSERRAETILWRERVTDMKRDPEEAAFLAGLELWKEALERRNAPAPVAKAGAATAEKKP
jgi:hypothetical protein